MFKIIKVSNYGDFDMKKFTLAMISACLAVCMLFSGCAQAVQLQFSNAFNAGTAPSTYSETLKYSVTLKTDYENGTIKQGEGLDKIGLSYDGEYTTTLIVSDSSSLPEDIKNSTDVFSAVNYEGVIYHITSSLTLNVSFNGKDGVMGTPEQPILDTIYSEYYFLEGGGNSFAPVYSSVKSKNTYISVVSEEEKVFAQPLVYDAEYTTVYNHKNYTVKKNVFAYEIGKTRTEALSSSNEENSYNYSFKTLIDNEGLLFCLRNVTLELDGTLSIPTVAPQYGSATTLNVTNIAEEQKTCNISYNGQDAVEEQLNVRKFSFIKNSNDTSGSAQYVTVSKSDTTKKAYVLEYAAPLSVSSVLSSFGALVYTLKSVN